MKTMRSIILVLSCLFVVIVACQAQHRLSVSGKIWDLVKEAPLGFADIVIYKDHVFIQGTQADSLGNYKISGLEPGKYRIEVSAIGFSNECRAIVLSYILQDLGRSELSQNRIKNFELGIYALVPCEAVIAHLREKNTWCMTGSRWFASPSCCALIEKELEELEKTYHSTSPKEK